jgi:hypothetical protein
MKQLNLTLLIIAIFAVNVFAQDPTTAWKDAGKAHQKFINSNFEDAESLAKAKEKIDEAVAGIDQIAEGTRSKVYERAGKVYFDVASNPSLKAKTPDAANKTLEYFLKTAEIGKPYQKESVSKELVNLGNIFVQDGQDYYEAQKYLEALKSFETALTVKSKIAELGNKLSTFLILPDQESAIKLYAGFAAYNGEDKENAKKYLEPLAAEKYPEPQMYSVLFKIFKDDNVEKAFEYLDAGVKLYPTERALLYDKINYYLATNQMDKLEIDLKKAIEGDPNNAQLTFTLGQVYEGLSSDSYKAENLTDGDKFFNSSIEYYNKTLSIDPKYFDAIYQIGAIHYNHAVRLYKQRANLGMNEDAKYKALSNGINDMYIKSWESFKKAELIKANDELLITAIKELYARTNQTAHYTEFKARLEKVQANKDTELTPYAHPDKLF